jgi:hypothetical protein
VVPEGFLTVDEIRRVRVDERSRVSIELALPGLLYGPGVCPSSMGGRGGREFRARRRRRLPASRLRCSGSRVWSTQGDDVVLACASGPAPRLNGAGPGSFQTRDWQTEYLARVYAASGRTITYLVDWHTHGRQCQAEPD